MRFHKLVSISLAALVAACVPRAAAPPPEPPPPVPSPTPTPSPTPAPAPRPSSWMDAPQTPGDWSYADGAASFGLAGAPRLVMTCSPGGTVDIVYLGAASELLTVRTETAERTVPARVVARPVQSVVSLPARDPLLDAIAFSKGRFALEAASGALYVPAWPEISRVIEDCR